MYMSQLAYKTVAFTLILDPRPSRPECCVARARISQNRATERSYAFPKSLSYDCQIFSGMKYGNRRANIISSSIVFAIPYFYMTQIMKDTMKFYFKKQEN